MKALGIDIGGTSLKAGIVDQKGSISGKTNILVKELREGNVIDNILLWVGSIIEKSNPASVGIGVPGLMSRSRASIKEVEALPEIEGDEFVDGLKSKFPKQVFYLENDANAAALGTHKFCDNVDTDTFGYVTIGTGIGSAVVVSGTLYLGENGNGPELGMITLSGHKTIDETSGKHGMLDICKKLHSTYANTTKIKLKNLTPEKLFIAAGQNDALALKVFETAGVDIGRALAVFIMLFDLSTIYVGGGISPAFKFLHPSMMQHLKAELTPYFCNKLIVKEASLGNDAGILGAAALCF